MERLQVSTVTGLVKQSGKLRFTDTAVAKSGTGTWRRVQGKRGGVGT